MGSMKRLVVLAVVLVACSHSSPPEAPKTATEPPPPVASEPPPADPGSAAPAPAESKPEPPPSPAEDTFISLSKSEKLDIMKKKVMPAMLAAFKGHDAKKFGKMNCKTCHGHGADDQSFKMPNPDLPKLDFAALHAGTIDAKTKGMVELMEKAVKPGMAKILGLTEFDPKNPGAGGFGCLSCHVQK